MEDWLYGKWYRLSIVFTQHVLQISKAVESHRLTVPFPVCFHLISYNPRTFTGDAELVAGTEEPSTTAHASTFAHIPVTLVTHRDRYKSDIGFPDGAEALWEPRTNAALVRFSS